MYALNYKESFLKLNLPNFTMLSNFAEGQKFA